MGLHFRQRLTERIKSLYFDGLRWLHEQVRKIDDGEGLDYSGYLYHLGQKQWIYWVFRSADGWNCSHFTPRNMIIQLQKKVMFTLIYQICPFWHPNRYCVSTYQPFTVRRSFSTNYLTHTFTRTKYETACFIWRGCFLLSVKIRLEQQVYLFVKWSIEFRVESSPAIRN